MSRRRYSSGSVCRSCGVYMHGLRLRLSGLCGSNCEAIEAEIAEERAALQPRSPDLQIPLLAPVDGAPERP